MISAKKCQALQVNSSKTMPQHADLKIGSDKLDYVDKANILGIWVQNDLKWQSQVDIMIKKANTRLFMLRSLKRFGFDQDELTIVYKSYVRLVLEYADVVGILGSHVNRLVILSVFKEGQLEPYWVTSTSRIPSL